MARAQKGYRCSFQEGDYAECFHKLDIDAWITESIWQALDRWFIYFSRGGLYFHRSWTGFCIYVAHFMREGNRHILNLIEAKRPE